MPKSPIHEADGIVFTDKKKAEAFTISFSIIMIKTTIYDEKS